MCVVVEGLGGGEARLHKEGQSYYNCTTAVCSLFCDTLVVTVQMLKQN